MVTRRWMSAIRPIAVATALFACRAPPNGHELFFEAEIDWKLEHMPRTVPTATNGPRTTSPEPAASVPKPRDFVVRWDVPHTFSIRIFCKAVKERVWILSLALPLAHAARNTPASIAFRPFPTARGRVVLDRARPEGSRSDPWRALVAVLDGKSCRSR